MYVQRAAEIPLILVGGKSQNPDHAGRGLSQDPLRDAIGRPHGGTHLGAAVRYFQDRPHNRLIVLTDEESQDPVGAPRRGVQGYMINVASTERSVGFGDWTRLTGFSEHVLSWIQVQETASA